jgi:hypothetical protein
MPYVPQTQTKSAQIAAAEKLGRMPNGVAKQSTATLSKRPMELYQKYLKMKEGMTKEEKKELLLGLQKMKENGSKSWVQFSEMLSSKVCIPSISRTHLTMR